MFTKDQVKINNLISGTTKVYGIIGNPVTFSLSPMIQNTLSSFLEIDSIYLPFPVEDGRLSNAIRGGHALNIQGFNVTHPYKQDVMGHLTYIDPLAKQIGAVNTLKYEGKGYSGYNTDADGLYTSLKQNNISLEDKEIIVLGAGGAARATLMMAAKYGARSIYILNRTLDKADLLAIEVKKYYNINVEVLPLDEWHKLPGDCICFQTTSVGMGKSKDKAPIDHDDFYKKISVAIDLIYNPFETLFLKKAKRQGSYTINGLGMLLYQAIKAYEIWNNIELTDSQLRQIEDTIERNIPI
ncbi:MAG: shikimate dehydrogenase [Epulopiscium sp.]|nr:shikimate dehydrogenase [Candidatus Epulonipiscium sp.]